MKNYERRRSSSWVVGTDGKVTMLLHKFWLLALILASFLCGGALVAGQDEKPMTMEDFMAARKGEPLPGMHLMSVPSINESMVTSVRCSPTAERKDRYCAFQNLCFWPRHEKFIFLHGRDSIMTGVPKDRFSDALLDSSGVEGHNTLFFEFTDVPQRAMFGYPFRYERGAHLLFRRFKPDNIMHVLHDDLLPLYHALQRWDTRTAECVRPTKNTKTASSEQSCEALNSSGDASKTCSSKDTDCHRDETDAKEAYTGTAAPEQSTSEPCHWPKVVYIDGKPAGPWEDWMKAVVGRERVQSLDDLLSTGET